MKPVQEERNIFQPKVKTEPRTVERQKGVRRSEIKPRSIENRHIDGVIIEMGTDSELPDGSTNTKAFFATDSNKLYLWNSEENAWKSVTLS